MYMGNCLGICVIYVILLVYYTHQFQDDCDEVMGEDV